MADDKAADVEYDDKGKPIVVDPKPDESAGAALEKEDAEKDEKEQPEFEDSETPDIPVRSSASHIIARKNRQIAKLKSQQEHDDEETEEQVVPDEGAGDGPVTRADLGKAVNEAVRPFIKTIVSNADESELQGLFTQDPAAKKMEKTIRAYMAHPSWQQVPVTAIYHHIAFKNAEAIGARRKEVADRGAQHTRGAGTTRRPQLPNRTNGVPTVEELDAMDDKELTQLANEVRQGKFLSK